MATNFYLKQGNTERDIESYFRVRVNSARGLEPPTPKELYTRDWASEDGVDYYVPPVDPILLRGRKYKSSELILTLWIEDDPSTQISPKTALEKYRTLCAHVWDGVFRYRDTLQGMYVNVIYNANKPSWYQFVGTKQVMAEITFTNVSGAVTLYVP